MRNKPFDSIKKSLDQKLALDMMSLLPDKWEKIGAVVIIKLPQELKQYQEMIGKAYAESLGCTTALDDVGGISGVFREPVVEVIYGPSMTETIHIENGIRYSLDPQKIMFSSGNMGERLRMATMSNCRETVVDLFAGIGYFSLPMAVYSRPKKVYACEINPVAYKYLCENVVLNQVTDIVEPLLGDNRKTAPKDCADRVILGYLQQPEVFLPVAIDALSNHKGILHYHAVVPVEQISDGPFRQVEAVVKSYSRSANLLRIKEIKSYAPGMNHVVLDVKVFE